MPLQRRLPKVGFRSRKALQTDEIRLNELHRISGDLVNLASLRKAGLIGARVKRVKIIASGTPARAFRVQGVGITKGARAAIESAGGTVES